MIDTPMYAALLPATEPLLRQHEEDAAHGSSSAAISGEHAATRLDVVSVTYELACQLFADLLDDEVVGPPFLALVLHLVSERANDLIGESLSQPPPFLLRDAIIVRAILHAECSVPQINVDQR